MMKRIYDYNLKFCKMPIVLFCIFTIFFISCKDSNVKTDIVDYNPSNPVAITSVEPDSIHVATQMLIGGTNFGGNKDLISVEVNGKKAAIINVNPEGTLIYCIVPSLIEAGEYHEGGDQIAASVKVFVGSVESNVPDKPLVYTFTQTVSTFLGYTDQDGNSIIADGTYDEAQFQNPFWMAFDTDVNGPKDEYGNPKKNIYVLEEAAASLRFIDLYNKRVETIFTKSNDLQRPRTIAYTLDGDTMIIANDGNDYNWNGTVIIPRNPVSRKFADGSPQPWRVVMHHKQCNGGAIHPVTGDYWFNSYEHGQVFKVFQRTSDGSMWKYGGPSASDINVDGAQPTHEFFRVQDDGWEFNIQIAPSGSFAYIVVRNQHYIAKTIYDTSTNAFLKSAPFVGSRQKSGFQDGVGTNTLFNFPQQGAFDKFDNFYVCDGQNGCIRKVTPQGQVSTFAGRPGNPGYSDGALRDAQFNWPLGIIYDDEIQTFYIADRDNHRIRMIKLE